MNKNSPLVSIVTPFYNTQLYLAECIESVLRQTYGNWEYVLLDNCSSDESLSIANRYAARDSRIRVIECSDFVGQIANYNRALQCISPESKYTKMVEADNWLYPDCLEKMVGLAEANDKVDVVGSYNITEHAVRFRGVRQQQNIYSGEEVVRMYFQHEVYPFGSPTTVLYRSAGVRKQQPFFPEDGIHAADLRACFDLLLNRDFGFVHQVLTFVRTDNESILSESENYDAMTLDRLVVLKSVGQRFFDADEFRDLQKRISALQYRILAFGMLTGKGIGFWRFHSSRMTAIGEDISYGRLLLAMLAVVVEWVANPGHTISAILRRLQRRA